MTEPTKLPPTPSEYGELEPFELTLHLTTWGPGSTQRALEQAFTEWDRRYREEPERFLSEATLLLKYTSDDYGGLAAAYLLKILGEQLTAVVA